MQGACTVLCFCSSKVAFRSLWSLCIFCPEFVPTGHACSYFKPHPVSLYFVAQGVKRCVQVQALYHCTKGPRFQSVSEPHFVIRSNWHSGLRLHHFISLKAELICKCEDGSTTQSIPVSKMKFYILLLISENILLLWSLSRKHLVQYEIQSHLLLMT